MQSVNNIRFFCRCSYLEIYNEKIIDLLSPSTAQLHILHGCFFECSVWFEILNSSLRIREDIKKGVYVEGLTEEVVTSSEEAYAVLKKGAKNR